MAARESYRRKFVSLLERALAEDEFVRSGRQFIRADVTGNQILVELQSAVAHGDYAAFYINVGVLLGIEIEANRQRRLPVNPTWRPTTANGVWNDRLSPDGFHGHYTWKLYSLDDAVRDAQRAHDGLRKELPRLKGLMDPDVMLAAAKAERWPRAKVAEGYVLAAQGRLDDVEDLLGTRGKQPSDLLRFERDILDVAHANAAKFYRSSTNSSSTEIQMGNFGLAVLARHPRHLAQLECIADVDSFAAVDETSYADGWRLGFLDSPDYPDDLAVLASQLVAETGAPAMALYINDGDYADAACDSPQGNACRFYLDEQAFLAYCSDFDEEDLAGMQLHRNYAALDVLVRWATEAGLTADREGLSAALATRPGPASDGLQQLIQTLGLRATR